MSQPTEASGTPGLIVEACVASVGSAIEAHLGGADRIELNRALDRDGLTPSDTLCHDVVMAVPLPVVVMVRPHDRGYAYTASEWETMEADVDRLLARGAVGVAIGALHEDRTVDAARIRRIVDRAQGAQVVCHRAFDETPDPYEALEALIDCGVSRVLTSGQARTAPEGVDTLARLVELADGRIEILPGAGLSPSNVAPLVEATGCRQVHGTFQDSTAPAGTDRTVVAAVRDALDRC